MSENNIELFNEHASTIFSRLYRHFPLPSHIEYRVVVLGEDPNTPPDMPGPGAKTPLHERVYNATAIWLADAGYIKMANSVYDGSAVLTSKGLETMKAVPSGLDNSASVGDRLVEATQSGAKETATQIVSQGLTQGFLMLMKSHGL